MHAKTVTRWYPDNNEMCHVKRRVTLTEDLTAISETADRQQAESERISYGKTCMQIRVWLAHLHILNQVLGIGYI